MRFCRGRCLLHRTFPFVHCISSTAIPDLSDITARCQLTSCAVCFLSNCVGGYIKDTEARDLLEIAEGRYKTVSTIFCSQFEVGGWHQKIGEPTLADAICDRIVHDSYTIVIGSEDSMRKHKGLIDEA